MSEQLSGSVGSWERGARNVAADVQAVQRLLTAAALKLQAPQLDPAGVDGKISKQPVSSSTVKAIVTFQSRFTSATDGVIEPGSQTWLSLLDAAGANAVAPEPPSASADCFFPFATVPVQGWEERPRAFASPRDGGARLHAGCDLYFACGTWIHAIADGTVIRGPYAFYCQTYALEIDHGSFLARYGEIQSQTEVKAGAKVRAGQRIAKVGHLVGIQVPSDMLHLELYDKSCSGPLTVGSSSCSAVNGGVAFMRRKDLIDPTMKLNRWRDKLPSE